MAFIAVQSLQTGTIIDAIKQASRADQLCSYMEYRACTQPSGIMAIMAHGLDGLGQLPKPLMDD